MERQELVQEGVASLLFAAPRYDAELTTLVRAYAAFCYSPVAVQVCEERDADAAWRQ